MGYPAPPPDSGPPNWGPPNWGAPDWGPPNWGAPPYGPPPPNWAPSPYGAPPPRNTTDVTISVIALVLTVLIGGAGSVLSFFSLAFLDYCPPATCSVDGAVTAVLMTIALVAVVALSGLIVTVIRLGRRKTAWPFAVGTLGAVVALFFFGAIAYTAAVS